jgi:hypothetical protein
VRHAETLAVDEDILSISAAIIRGKGGEVIPAVRSKGGWYISQTKNAPINKLRKEVDECLAKLEAAGVYNFNARMLDVPDQFIVELERLGVESGDVVHFVRPGLFRLGFPRTAALQEWLR